MCDIAKQRCALDALPILQWLRREAVRRTAETFARGRCPGLFQRHAETATWSFLRQAVRVPRDFTTIGEALEHAPSWPPTTVIVAAGSYSEELVLNKPVTLLGNECGQQATLTAAEKTMPVKFQLEDQIVAPPQLRGFCVVSDAVCVTVDRGSACVVDCNLLSRRGGGVNVSGSASAVLARNTFTNNKKAAVSFCDDATGAVKRCTFQDNCHVAVLVSGKARPTVVDNTFICTRMAAVMIRDHARCIIKANVFESNANCGIQLCDQVEAVVEANTLRGHTMPAIMVRDRATGVLRANIVEANLGLGIVACGAAHPAIEGNSLRKNRKSGGAPADQRRIDAQANALRASCKASAAATKVSAAEAAADMPVVVEAARAAARVAAREAVEAAEAARAVGPEISTFKSNKRAAIVVQDEAAPLVKSNVLEGNDGYGILVCHTARPTVEDNEVRGHCRPAIALRDKTECLIQGNTLTDNEGHGIIVCDDARPTLEGNILHGHKQPALWVGGTAGGNIRGNRFVGNSGYGIVIAGSACTTIENNELCGNGSAAILVQDGASGSVRSNRLWDNLSVGILVRQTGRAIVEYNSCSGACPPHISFQDSSQGALRRNRLVATSDNVNNSDSIALVSFSENARLDVTEQEGATTSPKGTIVVSGCSDRDIDIGSKMTGSTSSRCLQNSVEAAESRQESSSEHEPNRDEEARCTAGRAAKRRMAEDTFLNKLPKRSAQ